MPGDPTFMLKGLLSKYVANRSPLIPIYDFVSNGLIVTDPRLNVCKSV